MSDIETVIEDWIASVSLRTGPLTATTRLVDEGWLDSLQIVQLVEFLEKRFSISIDLEDMVAENFATIGAVAALVARSAGTSRAS
jgi:acyl carrier protein